VLQQLAKDRPEEATKYFEKFKDEIDGQLRAELGDSAKKASAIALGESAAAETWAKHGPAKDADPVELDKLEAKMRDQFKDNEFARTAGINALKERVAAHNSSQKEREAANVNAVMDGVRNGAGINQVRRLPEFQALPGSERLKIEEHIEAKQHLRLARSDAERAKLEREQLVTYSAAYPPVLGSRGALAHVARAGGGARAGHGPPLRGQPAHEVGDGQQARRRANRGTDRQRRVQDHRSRPGV
jgi:hypothetical protein